MGQQQPRLARRRLDAGGLEPGRGRADERADLAPGHGLRHSISASFAA